MGGLFLSVFLGCLLSSLDAWSLPLLLVACCRRCGLWLSSFFLWLLLRVSLLKFLREDGHPPSPRLSATFLHVHKESQSGSFSVLLVLIFLLLADARGLK